MSLYKYKALDSNHCIVESTIKSDDFNEAKQKIIEKGFTPISITESKDITNIRFNVFEKIKIQEIIVFCRELSIITKSGINIIVGLDILRKQSSKRLQEIIRLMSIEVQKGRTLSQAIKESNVKFPELLVRMISAGEKSGNVDNVLDNMANYYERENYIKQKVKSATIYPSILLIVAGALVTFFAKFILPSMEELLEGQKLPAITKLIIDGTNFIASRYAVIILFVILAIGIGIYKIIPKVTLQRFIDKIILNTPILGSAARDVVTVRFTRTLHLLFKSGIDIVNVLEIVKDVISNSVAKEAIEHSLEGIKRGEKFGDTLSQTNFFDPLVVQMINVGEETGEFENILNEITIFYERRLDSKIDKLISMVEPIFTLLIGGVIAVVVIAIALPMFSMVGGLETGGLGVE